jgi:chromosome segregation ATPase
MGNEAVSTAGWAAVYAAGATALGGVFGVWLQGRFAKRNQGETSLSTERQSLLAGMQARITSSDAMLGQMMETIKDLQEALRDCEALHRSDAKEIRAIERKNEMLEQQNNAYSVRIRRLELRLPPGALDSDYDNGVSG